eukprot:c5572_g1_i1.p1 GENE.c5572_g1_i1~~c5572_g1_i1.p1  ORF type:complete len:307 (-),score=72.40 c5572_g1_i1:853-1746(-)
MTDITPLLTDMYQVTMAASYFKCNRHEEIAQFELFFRKAPFKGEYAVFAGLDAVLHFLANFKFEAEHIAYLKTVMKADEEFFDWLATLDTSAVRVHSLKEGTVCFPHVPMVQVEGPLAVCQLIETPLLNLINFSTLVATNSARFRQAAGDEFSLIEFGLRRAQGPNGAMTATRCSFLGGFNGTSNLQAGFKYQIPVRGTHAHAFVSSFQNWADVKFRTIKSTPESSLKGAEADFVDEVLRVQSQLQFHHTHPGELAAFTAYAITYPASFLALVDTYNTLQSGVKVSRTRVCVLLCFS